MRKLILISMIMALLLFAGCTKKKEEMLVAAGKDFTEQDIMANLMKEVIEGNTDIKVTAKGYLGSTNVVSTALERGDIDMYVEYTGTALINLLKLPMENDTDKIYDIISEEYLKKGLVWFPPLGFNNTYAVAVTKATAEKYGFNKISDLAAFAPMHTLAMDKEFVERPDGIVGLEKRYGINFKEHVIMQSGLMYTALVDDRVDAIIAFTTDGRIPRFDLKVLEDDQHYLPPYYAAVVVRKEVLDKYPDVAAALNSLSGRLTDESMSELNAKVDQDKMDAAAVAREWLKSEGLI